MNKLALAALAAVACHAAPRATPVAIEAAGQVTPANESAKPAPPGPPEPLPTTPLLCGDRILVVGRTWRESRDTTDAYSDGGVPACNDQLAFWTDRRPVVVRTILALTGDSIDSVGLTYPPSGRDRTLRRVRVDSIHHADASVRISGLDPQEALTREDVLADAVPPNDPSTWRIPPGVLTVDAHIAVLDDPVTALLLPRPTERARRHAIVRYAGLADRSFGRVRAFSVDATVSDFAEGMCHRMTTTFAPRGTVYFAEHEDVLVEAVLSGPTKTNEGLCTGCGKDHQQRCPESSCEQGEARFEMRLECDVQRPR
jgi:hypothetical protein